MSKRLNVRVNLGTINYGLLSIDDLQKFIDEARKRMAAENIGDVYLELSYERGYYDDIEVTGNLTGTREETDEEMQLRLAKETEQTQVQKAREYSEYLRLRKKYENYADPRATQELEPKKVEPKKGFKP